MSEPKVVQALSAFSLNLKNGVPHSVRAGDLYHSDDYVVKANPAAFGDVNVLSSAPVAAAPVDQTETADAAPGARRSMSKSGKGASK